MADESWFKGKDGAMGVRLSDGSGKRGGREIMDQVMCCCGPRWGRKYSTMDESSSTSPPELRTKGRWQVDEDDEYFKPPVWKQILLKVKAQARQANCGTNSGHWENYDSQSYKKNFDNGEFEENTEFDDKLGLKEQAMLQTLASTRALNVSDADFQVLVKSKSNPPSALSPSPVNRSKDDFVPIWQRRASSPVTLDVRHRA